MNLLQKLNYNAGPRGYEVEKTPVDIQFHNGLISTISNFQASIKIMMNIKYLANICTYTELKMTQKLFNKYINDTKATQKYKDNDTKALHSNTKIMTCQN